MRTPRLLGAAVALAVSVALLAGCSSADTGSPPGAGTVGLLIPGTAGDGGFFDQASAGTREGAQAAGWTPKVVEAGYEPTKWQPALDDLSGSNADPVITGTFAMTELVEQAAAQFPDKKFVVFDAQVDAARCGCTNVYSITYRYDETGFLAGALAGLLTRHAGVDKVKRTGVVGVVGGQDIPVIQDYVRGFEQGVKSVAPEVKVLSAFAGSFSDPVQGKAVAQDMISQGAEVLFAAAGQTDRGVFEAAAGNDIWALGNSTAQARSPQVGGKDTVLTSADTNVAKSIKDAVVASGKGQLPVGTVAAYGVKDGSVSLVRTPLYERVVPADVREKMTQVTADLAAGKYESALVRR
ncbi:BMP family lipoprotein [Pseudonocardia spinosispora]|uniref:BMP family lipoprotein n=1 Tax=Pseudonocardia spinosispora TaxID=103441 RepID=UPI0004176BE1|nr:BMP family ABC transporter substrate-binding protein [Pseudonocardia spinosispora]